LIPVYLKSEIDEETDKLIKEQVEIEQKLLSIKLKVHYNNDSKTLSFKKNDKYQEVSLKILEEFGLSDIKLENFRLRSYDPKLKAKMDYYEGFEF
jgi:hypothetical protein